MSDSEYEYEYEYDDNETETFFVNIDLTSYNGPIKPRRRRQPAQESVDATPSSPPRAVSPDNNNHNHDNPERARPADPSASTDSDYNIEDRIQIMELHSDNPLISYGNQIFSCEWADMIGTDMHFTRREIDQDGGDGDNDPDGSGDNAADPSFLKHGTNYSLIAANRIKLIGRRVHLISADQPQQGKNVSSSSTAIATANTKNQQQQQEQNQEQQEADIAGPVVDTAQARFLQEMMDIKRAKGETDMILGRRSGRPSDDKVSRWAQTEERLNLIHQLNRDAIAGDINAARKLEELYDQIDRDANNLAPAVDASLARQTPG